LISRRGFTKPALAKCAHYGVQPLSLIPGVANGEFFMGMRWEADVARWGQIAVTLHFKEEPSKLVHFNAQDLRIQGKKVIDWFTNYLLDADSETEGYGWVVGFTMMFDDAQWVEVREGSEHLCVGITFRAERVCDKLERMVGISGTGFFDWNLKQATFAPNTPIGTDAVPMDFGQWQPRTDTAQPNGFITIKLVARAVQFEHVLDAIDLDVL